MHWVQLDLGTISKVRNEEENQELFLFSSTSFANIPPPPPPPTPTPPTLCFSSGEDLEFPSTCFLCTFQPPLLGLCVDARLTHALPSPMVPPAPPAPLPLSWQPRPAPSLPLCRPGGRGEREVLRGVSWGLANSLFPEQSVGARGLVTLCVPPAPTPGVTPSLTP